ncbi:hypothetical protein DV735_g5008, partial [Chaetothyriales sp. CBS 134920]
MTSIFADFHEAQRTRNGNLLATCLAPINTAQHPRRVEQFAQLSNEQTISTDVRHYLLQTSKSVSLPKAEGNCWVDIFVSLWKCVRELSALEHRHGGDWAKAYEAYRDVCTSLLRGYTHFSFQAWTVPCLYTAGKFLRIIAIQTDQLSKSQGGQGGNGQDDFSQGLAEDLIGTSSKYEKLENAAWVMNRMFQVCLSDRSELAKSRKWAIYSTSNLLFKTYFKLGSVSLTKNVIRALVAAEADLPPLELFPKSHQCTFKYYRGVIDFLSENYGDAEHQLSEALALCHRDAHSNREQILTYLIPCYVISSHKLPTASLLAPYPNLSTMLTPLFAAIRTGNLLAFDRALAAAEPELVRRRIYLTLERTRDLCMRNLFRKVFLHAGWEEVKHAATASGATPNKIRRTRIRVDEFEAAMRVAYRGSDDTIIERDEVECFLANMIYKVGIYSFYLCIPPPLQFVLERADSD